MANLKTLICSRISAEALNYHSNLKQEEGNHFVNTSFSIVIKSEEILYRGLYQTFDAL